MTDIYLYASDLCTVIAESVCQFVSVLVTLAI